MPPFSVGSVLHAHDQGLIFEKRQTLRHTLSSRTTVRTTQVGRIHATLACTLVTVGSRPATGQMGTPHLKARLGLDGETRGGPATAMQRRCEIATCHMRDLDKQYL